MIHLLTRTMPMVIGLACVFLTQALLARWANPEIFGEYIYYITWITTGGLLAKAGYEWTLLKEIPKRISSGELGQIRFIVTYAFKGVAWRAAAFVCILLLLSGLLTSSINIYVKIIGSILVFAIAFSELRRSWALAYGNIWLADAPENIIKSGLMLIAAFTLLQKDSLNAYNLLLSNLGATIFTTLMATGLFIALRQPQFFKTPPVTIKTKEIFEYSQTMWFLNGVNIILRNADVIIVGIMTNPYTTGLYAVASRMGLLISTPATLIGQVLAPKISASFKKEDRHKLSSMIRDYSAICTAVAVSLVFLFFLFGNFFIQKLFGPEYAQVTPIVWIFLFANFPNSLTAPSGLIMSLGGGHRESAIISAGCAVLLISLLFLLTPLYLELGAAIAFSIAMGTKSLILAFMVRRKFGIGSTFLGI